MYNIKKQIKEDFKTYKQRRQSAKKRKITMRFREQFRWQRNQLTRVRAIKERTQN